MKALRIGLWVLVAIGLAGLGYLLLRQSAASDQSDRITASTFGGPFTLTDAKGQPFNSSRLNGKPHAVFFGFTNCPDVCPTTLARLVQLREQLGHGAEAFEILFVTVDPERDGPAEVGKYAELFDSPVIGLTGSPAQIDQVKKQYGIFSEKVPDESGGYGVDHTSTVLLFNGKGDFVATLSPEEGKQVALDKLKRITA